MKKLPDEMKKNIIAYLKRIVSFDPQINPQTLGECIYCGVALDEGKSHILKCPYLEAKQLLRKLKVIQKNNLKNSLTNIK